MNGKREQVFFVVTLVLVGALTAWSLGDDYRRLRTPSPQPLESATPMMPADVQLGPAFAFAGAGGRDRSVFAPPRELLPMDPLVLPEPPLPLLSVRRPAVTPALMGPRARRYRVPADALGALVLDGGESEPNDAFEVDTTGPAGTGNGGDGNLAEQVLEEQFDWIVRVGSSRRLYGRILNADPHGLRDRVGEDLEFQQVSERHGGPLGFPFTLPRLEVERFGLADTFENAYLFKSRELGSGPGSAASRRALALEMLDAWPGEPQGLEFARIETDRAWEAGGPDAGTARLRVAVLRRARDLEGELAVYRDAADGGYADGALLAGHALLMRDLGLTERVRELLDEGRRLSRASAEVRYVEGLLALDEGRWEEAESNLAEATQLPLVGPLEQRWRTDIMLALGRAEMALGKVTGASRQADRILLDDDADVGGLALRAAALAASDDVDAAAEVLAEALALAPDDADLLTNAALAAWRQGEGAAAVRMLEQARDMDPFRALRPTLALGFLYEDAGRQEAARELYADALALEPGHPEALYRLGRNQRRDGDPDAAVATLRRALRLGGSDVLLLTELAFASLDRGDVEAARRYLREAERVEPDNAEVQWYLGLAALLGGDVHAAPAPLERAVAGGQPGAHVAQGVAAYRRGEARVALDQFDEALKAYAGRSDHPQARYAAEQTARIRDNMAKRQWLDRFGRTTLQRGWLEHHWDGSPRVFLDGGVLRVEGRMERPRDDERPGITRPLDGRRFHAVAVEVTAGTGTETRCGVSLTYRQVRGAQGRLPKARLDLWVDPDGTLRISALDNFNTLLLDGEALDVPAVPAGNPVRLGIERTDAVTGTFTFTVDGRPAGDPVNIKALRDFKNPFDLSVYAEGPPGSRVSATVAMVRIVQAP